MHEPPNALQAISDEVRRIEAGAGRRPLEPDDIELYALISRVRDARSELATAMEEREVRSSLLAGRLERATSGRLVVMAADARLRAPVHEGPGSCRQVLVRESEITCTSRVAR